MGALYILPSPLLMSCIVTCQAGEKEYYLASACEEIYTPPSASLSLRGFAVSGEWAACQEEAESISSGTRPTDASH